MWLPLPHPRLGTWPTTRAWVPTGNRTGDPSVHRLALNPLSHTSQGRFFLFPVDYLLSILLFISMLRLLQNRQVAVPLMCLLSFRGYFLSFWHKTGVPGSSYTVLAPESAISLLALVHFKGQCHLRTRSWCWWCVLLWLCHRF